MKAMMEPFPVSRRGLGSRGSPPAWRTQTFLSAVNATIDITRDAARSKRLYYDGAETIKKEGD